jgi:CRP-like cAMP-binding protein
LWKEIYRITAVYMEQLKQFINLVCPMRPEDLHLLPQSAAVISIKKKANLLAQGDVCEHIYFLRQGFFRMFYVDLEGNEINTRFTQENNFMVDFQSFLTQKPSQYYWQAMQDSELIAFTYKDVQKLYDSSPAWERFGRLVAERVYLQLNERVEMLQFMSPEQRYSHLLKIRPELFNQISQFQMASYLGIKPESLSRLRKRLLYK